MNYDVDYVDAVPLPRRSTKKKQWNPDTNTWDEYTIWTINSTRDLLNWLEKNYPNKDGWGTAWSDSKIIMEEKVYIHYCLIFQL